MLSHGSGTRVQEWLDDSIGRPRVRQLFAAMARTFVYSTALDLISSVVFVDELQRSLRHPVHYIDGGRHRDRARAFWRRNRSTRELRRRAAFWDTP